MADKKFNLKEFERRERDILDRHRMPLDAQTDIQELMQSMPGEMPGTMPDIPGNMPPGGMMPDPQMPFNQAQQGY